MIKSLVFFTSWKLLSCNTTLHCMTQSIRHSAIIFLSFGLRSCNYLLLFICFVGTWSFLGFLCVSGFYLKYIIVLLLLGWCSNFKTFTKHFLTHSFPVHPFSTPWKHQKTLRFSDVFRGQRKGALRTIGLKVKPKPIFYPLKHNFLEGRFYIIEDTLEVCQTQLGHATPFLLKATL